MAVVSDEGAHVFVNSHSKKGMVYLVMKKKKRICVISQGCRLNHSESAELMNKIKATEELQLTMDQSTDLVVINTCTVTENGDKDTIRLVNKVNQTCKSVKIALIGCQSQIKQQQLLSLKNVNWVVGNQSKSDVMDIIMNQKPGSYMAPFTKEAFFQTSSFDPKHTRVNLKIQDGCDFYCSFCIIPFARGPARSRDFNDIVNDAKQLHQLGIKELILTGINLGTYENNGATFYDLLEAMLTIHPELQIRISSIEPTTVDERLIDFWNEFPNLCRYLHLPIQSATNTILKKMRRKYTLLDYDNFITAIKKKRPDICIGTDVIVGFPGESDDLFHETKTYLSESLIDYFHVFSYSERTMAHSRKFDDQVPQHVIKQRSQTLRTVHLNKWQRFLNQHVDTVQSILFEQKKNGVWVGTSDQFIKVRVQSEMALKNKRMSVRLTSVQDDFMYGELL